MKKIFSLIFVFISLKSLSQGFPQYRLLTNELTRTEVGALYAKKGIINGAYADTTAANADYIDFYNGAQIWTRSDRNFWLRDSVLNTWIRIAKGSEAVNIYNTDGLLTTNRRLSGVNHTYSLQFDSLNVFSVWRNGVSRIYMNNLSAGFFSPDGLNSVFASDAIVGMSFNNNANYLRLNGDSSFFHKRVSYEGNIHSTFFPYSLVDKSYVDSAITAGGGTPTWQSVLTAGSTLTTNNTIENANNLFTFRSNNSTTYESFLRLKSDSVLLRQFSEAGTAFFKLRRFSSSYQGFEIYNNTSFGTSRIYLDVPDSDEILYLTNTNSAGKQASIGVGTGAVGLNALSLMAVGDSIRIQPHLGIVNIDSLASTSDTTLYKPIVRRSNGQTKQFDYWPSGGGGSGTVNTGAANKAAYYPSSGTTVDDWAGVDFGTTNLNTKITAQATTEVGLEIKGQSSQTANLLNISSSAGTGDILKVIAAGETHINNVSDKGAYWIQTEGSSAVYGSNIASNGSLIEGNASSGAGNYFVVQNTGGTKWSVYAGGGMNLELGAASTGIISFAPAFSGKGNFQSTGFYVGSASTAASARLDIAGGTATAGTAPLKINSGTVLTTTEAGAIENDGTHLYYTAANGGTRYQLDRQVSAATQSKATTFETPSASETIDMWQTPVAITVTSLKAILRGSASPSVTYNIKFGTDITSATDVFTANITCTSTTTGCSNSTGFNDATIPAGSFIWVVTTAQSGTVNSISLTLNYTVD